AVAAHAHARAVRHGLGADARAPAALAADHHHVAGVDRRLALGDAALDVALRVGPGVPLDEAHALHDDAVLVGQHLQDLALLAGVAAGDDLHQVFLLQPYPRADGGFGGHGHGYRTSGASEMIFMN